MKRDMQVTVGTMVNAQSEGDMFDRDDGGSILTTPFHFFLKITL